ncbi:hypothetical protein WH47_10714 [Habropoda laboriosa]|uniref:Uncharacterized protein n=1 Tax=Habropoda laboriosa TaxID=597456 RepID=A0A0L7RCC2_9HYME|nr:PREDICTED: uncharacterized protein LOC108579805 [Habropoda laboriosa]KOC68474.1 hypothetical protein WH47_10714 [Habropoda laboriosa]
MGNYVNKFFSHNNEIEKGDIKDQSSTEEVTVEKYIMQTPPIIHKTLPVDPRSVTSGIDRTPIEMNSTPVGLNRRIVSAIPRHLQTRPYLETDIDKVMPCLTPRKPALPRMIETTKLQLSDVQNNAEVFLTPTVNDIVNKNLLTAISKDRYDILGLDPRSPAADFDRTPILMPKSMESLKARSQENLHRRGSYDTDVYYPRFSYCEMSSQFNVPEIQALPDLATCVIKNLDLVKDDCNDKCSESESCSSHSSRSENVSENDKELEEEDEIQMISDQDNYNDTCVNKNTEQKEICVNDVIKVWRDSLVLNEPQESETCESDDIQTMEERISHILKEEVILTLDDSIDKDILSGKLPKFESDKTKVDTIGNKKQILKLEKIITDEKKILNFNDKSVNELKKIRTPLGNRSNNRQMQTLLANSPQQMFKNKGIVPKKLQENTPPPKKDVAKSRLNSIEWDPDSTVII